MVTYYRTSATPSPHGTPPPQNRSRSPSPFTPPPTESVLEMYHFEESISTIQEGLEAMLWGIRNVEAGIENLRVMFDRFEELCRTGECGRGEFLGSETGSQADAHGDDGDERSQARASPRSMLD